MYFFHFLVISPSYISQFNQLEQTLSTKFMVTQKLKFGSTHKPIIINNSHKHNYPDEDKVYTTLLLNLTTTQTKSFPLRGYYNHQILIHIET